MSFSIRSKSNFNDCRYCYSTKRLWRQSVCICAISLISCLSIGCSFNSCDAMWSFIHFSSSSIKSIVESLHHHLHYQQCHQTLVASVSKTHLISISDRLNRIECSKRFRAQSANRTHVLLTLFYPWFTSNRSSRIGFHICFFPKTTPSPSNVPCCTFANMCLT